MIRFLLADTSLQPRLSTGDCMAFATNIGTPQGDSLSPVLFTVYLEAAFRDLRSRLPMRPPEDAALPLDVEYADNTDFISTSRPFLNDIECIAPPCLAESGRKIHAGTRHFAMLPLSLAVKPLKCAEGARHDLLPCPDCQNISKWGKSACQTDNKQTTIFIFTFTCMMLLCHQSSRANHRFPNWSLDGSENVCRHLVIKTCTASSYLARHGNCAAL